MIIELRDFIKDHPWPEHIQEDPYVTFHFRAIRSPGGKLEISLLDAFYYNLWKFYFVEIRHIPADELARLKQSAKEKFENTNWTRSRRRLG